MAKESETVQPSVSDHEQVVDTMIALTRLSNLHRTIIAGSDSMKLYLSLRRRGFIRVGTPATCGAPRREHSVGLIAGLNLLATIEAALSQVVHFLEDRAAMAILIDPREAEFRLKIRRKLEQMGFRIEAGVRCHQGLVLSAYRQGLAQMGQAA
jgi:hypothetical protein